jgi:CheY-like chemotaxis protein
MPQPTLAKPRVLVVEDESVIRGDVRRCLHRIPEHMRHQYGIDKFDIDEAGSVAEAMRHLDVRKGSSRPYDLVLLDLNLPKSYGAEGTESLGNGLHILKYINDMHEVGGIVIISGYCDYLNVVRTLRGGALDFVPKPFFQENLEPAILRAWTIAMTQRSREILYGRVWDLAAYAEIGLTHTFKIVFFRLLQDVAEAADGVEKYVYERYGLDAQKHANDALITNLRGHQKAIAQARQDWAVLQAELAGGGSSLVVGHVRKMLSDLRESLLPCLLVKKVALVIPDFDDTPVLTFEKDVEMVLREIILGAVAGLPDYGEERQIRIRVITEDARARVSFDDDLDPIPSAKMDAVNAGQRIIPDTQFGRVWGLSVVQHTALRGGGELVVKTERGRNVVTYYIPVAE